MLAVNHWNEVEYSVGAPVVETGVEALMPHFGYTPCWYRSATPFGKSVRKGHAADPGGRPCFARKCGRAGTGRGIGCRVGGRCPAVVAIAGLAALSWLL